MQAKVLDSNHFTNIKPKGLLPVANKPLIFYGIEKLVELGIDEIGIVIRPNLHAMFMEEVGLAKDGMLTSLIFFKLIL